MNELAIIITIICSFAAGCIVAAVLSRVNDLKSDELDPEPLGEMVNIREIMNRYSGE
jgi:hypothetical protein